jgi:Fibronectin type III domain
MRCALSRTAMSLAMVNCIFGLAGCGGGSEATPVAGALVPPTAPAPAPTPAPPPTPSPPPTYSATVSWSVPVLNTDGTSLTDVSGYRVHYGTSPTNLTQSIPISGAAVTSHVVSGLTPGTYYFAVATLNSNQASSARSNVVSKTVP